ncbi:hypothetical protein D9757_002052 [Collybiopsis confluens]|uniref:RING-type domain-containing protein n=1 Tax=Collybiopsis confluens TaxID=2823264 RepID=A0A8H5MEY4_9AGAR|nr:hypothetical protein D9757_002052 [Collybiopsis confluens]
MAHVLESKTYLGRLWRNREDGLFGRPNTVPKSGAEAVLFRLSVCPAIWTSPLVMGNSSSSSSRSHDETVDFGSLSPQGVYTGLRDWNQAIVTQLICARRLAPFYRPLEDYDESWTDDQILAARKDPLDPEGAGSDSTPRSEPLSALSASARPGHSKRPNTLKDPSRPEAAIYRGAAECPICFLYYPPNINHSRCCDQAICTECFVQIKRSEPTTTHLVSEPAACPYCVQENFGVVYTPPPWRAGIGSEGSHTPRSDSPRQPSSETHPPTHKRRQKSFSADSPEVVTTGELAIKSARIGKPNWPLVGDQLIPVGVTSGRVHALLPEEASGASDNGGNASWRSRRRQQTGANGLEQYLGQDLEELMMMEAMRLSLIEHEAQQRREAEEKKKAEEQAKNGITSIPLSEPVASSSMEGSNSIDPTATHQKGGSLRVKRGSFFSRSRSPSPAPNQSSSSIPGPFSTLGAALTTSTSTANAILRNSSPSSTSSDHAPENSDSTRASHEATRAAPESASSSSLPSASSTPPVPPSITIAPPPSQTGSMLSAAPTESRLTMTSQAELTLPPTSPLSEDSQSFENLPSSPEESSYEPLIPKCNSEDNASSDANTEHDTHAV